MTLYYKAKLIGADEPSVWRVLALPNTATYHDLHRAIQEAFDWQDCHLYEFRDALEVYHSRNEWRVQDHECMDWEEEFPFYPENSRTTRLIDRKQLLTHFFYEYDFGDSWKLDITLERFDRTRLKTAACVAKRGAPPPEDCGSLSGFERVRRFLRLSKQDFRRTRSSWTTATTANGLVSRKTKPGTKKSASARSRKLTQQEPLGANRLQRIPANSRQPFSNSATNADPDHGSAFCIYAPNRCTSLAHHYCLKRTKFVLLYIKSPFLKHSSVFLLSASFAFFFGKI